MNRVIQFVIAYYFSFGVFAANPSFQSFNTDQFDTTANRVALKNGLQVTNIVLFGSSSNLFEVWNLDNELKFYIDTNGVPSTELWTNSAGTIQASSTATGGATSFKLNSSNTLSTAFPSANLLALANNGTNIYEMNAAGYFGIGVPLVDGLFHQLSLVGSYPDAFNSGFSDITGSDASGTSSFEIHADATSAFLILTIASAQVANLNPSTSSSATPYSLGTSVSHTSGNLLEVKNNTTNKFTISYDGNASLAGAVIPSGNTNQITTGSGRLKFDAVNVVTASSTDALTEKTFNAASSGNVLSQIKSLKLQFPRLVDGAGCTYANTNDYTALTFMLPQFSGTAATNVNFCQFAFRVPKDLDTSVDLTGSLTIRLTAADTAAHAYTVGMVSIANSSSAAGTAANYVTLTVGADGSGASGDIENVNDVTLSGWRSAMTAGQWCLVQLQRDGSDSSTVASNLMELEIFYTSTQ